MNRREATRLLISIAAAGLLGQSATSAVAAPGRPASPTSVGGVRRRTRRRTRRRVRRRVRRGTRLSYLPYGCSVTRVRGGVTYYYCGGIWYKPVYSGTTVVYVVDRIDDGANTEVEFEEEVWED